MSIPLGDFSIHHDIFHMRKSLFKGLKLGQALSPVVETFLCPTSECLGSSLSSTPDSGFLLQCGQAAGKNSSGWNSATTWHAWIEFPAASHGLPMLGAVDGRPLFPLFLSPFLPPCVSQIK